MMSPSPATLSPGSRETILAFADDEHMVGARHTNWIGLGPFLEEDLAFCSIAQDELGHAIALYERILGLEPSNTAGMTDDRVLDNFAIMRDASEYRSCALAEAECSDWSDALVRHWLYDTAEQFRWQALVGSSDEQLALLAARVEREESFHRLHANHFMSVAAAGGDESKARIQASLDWLIPLGYALWTPVEGEPEALADRTVTMSSAELAPLWSAEIAATLDGWGLQGPTGLDASKSRTIRSDGFDRFHSGLQDVLRIDTNAIW